MSSLANRAFLNWNSNDAKNCFACVHIVSMDKSRDFVLKLVNIIKFTVIDTMLEVSPQKELQRVKIAGNVRPRHDVS